LLLIASVKLLTLQVTSILLAYKHVAAFAAAGFGARMPATYLLYRETSSQQASTVAGSWRTARTECQQARCTAQPEQPAAAEQHTSSAQAS
jgi:hypothetical protein